MKPNTDLKAAADKELRALERELRVLRRIQWDAPLVPLDQPYQRGWERWFEWTPEALLLDDVERPEKLLEVLQKREVSRWQDFRSYVWKRRKQVPMPHKSPQWSLWSFVRLKLPPELWGNFETHRYGPLNQPGNLETLREIRWGGPISFRHPQWLVSRLGPHWITHRRVAMPEVESRIAEIEAWMDRSGGWQKLGRLHGHRRWRGDGRRARLLVWPCTAGRRWTKSKHGEKARIPPRLFL